MIETIENSIQLLVSVIFGVASVIIAYRKKLFIYSILTLFYAAVSLGNLYWILYLVFYGSIPNYSYISEISWYAAWMFLLLLLRQVQNEKKLSIRHPAMWFVPFFTISMCIFYMQYGDYIDNIITALLMTLLIWRAICGCFMKEGNDRARKRFCIIALLYCIIEYTMWTASCYFAGDTLLNPYFWFDGMFTVCMALFFPAIAKVVEE